MRITENDTLAKIVSENFKAAAVFNKYGLDFCCNGKKSILDACNVKSLDSQTIIDEVNETSAEESSDLHLKYWSADFLSDYIVMNHHQYIRDTMPLILKHSEKAARAHGKDHPAFGEIFKIFSELSEELTAHMDKEERMLFPFIKKITKKELNSVAPFGSVLNPITVMEQEHEFAGAAMRRIREITSNYTLPEGLCETCKVLYKELNDFEKDLHIHVHLENNVLFPMAVKIENEKENSCSVF